MNKQAKLIYELDKKKALGMGGSVFTRLYYQDAALKLLRYYRILNNAKHKKFHLIAFLKFCKLRTKHDCFLDYRTQIGPAITFPHGINFCIATDAVIGSNVSILQNVTIGRVNGGKRDGAPTIGNNVWIGPNAVVVGNIHVGNNVLIAGNSFVDFDVPDNSVVLGNPGQIFQKDNPTKGYGTIVDC